MPTTRDLEDLSTALVLFRRFRGASQQQVAAVAGIPATSLSGYENGNKEPTDRNLGRILDALCVPPLLFDAFVSCIRAARELVIACDALPGGSMTPADEIAAEAAGRVSEEFTRVALTIARGLPTAPAPTNRDRLVARGLLAELEPFSHKERADLVQAGTRFRSWALAELYCAASETAAADDPQKAVELAELAVHISRLVPGTDRWRRQVQSHCGHFLSNGLRVSGNPSAAEEGFDRSNAAWPAGEPDDYGLLNVSRGLDLEASLRRDQRRLPEALDLLEKALVICPQGSTPTILLKKAKTLEELGEHEAALTTIEKALLLIEPENLPLLFAARFNLIVILSDLKRHAEAEVLLLQIRQLAESLNKGIHMIRFRWLEGRIAAGLERTDEAIKALQEARSAFIDRAIAYDAALVTLELAVLLAEQGRTAEVKQLASETEPIFKAHGVERERLGALWLFCQAARRQRITVEVARRLLEDLRRAASWTS